MVQAEYPYYDPKGSLVAVKRRYDGKKFSWKSSDGNGGFTSGLNRKIAPLYNLTKLPPAIKNNETIFIVEGEKDCDTLENAEYLGVTNPDGAGKWRPRDSQHLKNANIIILPDNDSPGEEHAQKVAQSLYGTAKSIKKINLPRLEKKEDVSDWFALRGGSKSELESLIHSTPEWRPSNSIAQVSQKSEGVTEGQRNNTLFNRCNHMKAAGLPFETAKDQAIQQNKKFSPPLPEYEVLSCLNSAYGYNPRLSENLTDTGNSKRLVRMFGEHIRFCSELGWLVWKGDRWLVDCNGAIERLAKQCADSFIQDIASEPDADRKKTILKHLNKSESLRSIKAMVELAKSEPDLTVPFSQFDRDPNFINANGIHINLKTGEPRKAKPNDYCTKSIGIHYDPLAKCPQWTNHINKIFAGDLELIRFIQKAVGYCLTGLTTEQVLFFLHGSGANGKSTFLTVIRQILADYASSLNSSSLMVKHNQSTTNDIANLKGARAVFVSELEKGQRLDEALVKQITGGDEISARFLYREFFQFTPQFKLWMMGNYVPEIRGTDHGIWRRIHLIPFNVQFSDKDKIPGYDKKLLAESPGILNWMIEGCLLWQREGLDPPSQVINSTKEYRSNMDIVQNWINECATVESSELNNCIRTANALYQSYCAWCSTNKEFAMKQTAFGNELRGKGFTKKRINNVTTYLDIGVINPFCNGFG